MPRLLSALIVGPPLAGTAVCVAYLARLSPFPSLNLASAASLEVFLAEPFALALIVWAAVSGVRLARTPRWAWRLAFAGASAWLAALLILDADTLVQGLLGPAWSSNMPWVAQEVLAAVGMVLLVIALALGLPESGTEADQGRVQ